MTYSITTWNDDVCHEGEEMSPIYGPEKECRADYDGWICTRPVGHTGRHVAHGFEGEFLFAWEESHD